VITLNHYGPKSGSPISSIVGTVSRETTPPTIDPQSLYTLPLKVKFGKLRLPSNPKIPDLKNASTTNDRILDLRTVFGELKKMGRLFLELV